MPGMDRLLWICLAGAAGTGTRYLISVWAAERFGTDFPLGTLVVNLGGCFLMALLVEAAFRGNWSETMRLAVSAGFLGGLTTYSSFNFEATRFLETGAASTAGAYAAATIGGAFVAGWAGLALGRQIFN
jgi:CrcB protein